MMSCAFLISTQMMKFKSPVEVTSQLSQINFKWNAKV